MKDPEFRKICYATYLLEIQKKYGNRTAIKSQGKSITYNDLIEDAKVFAAALSAKGNGPGDKIVIQLSNTILFVQVLFAVLWIGAIPVLAYPACREMELDHIVKTAAPKTYISFEKFKGWDYCKSARRIAEKNSCIKTLLFAKEIETIIQNSNSKQEVPYFCDADETAMIILSGGSTGVPKLIARRHGEHIYSFTCCGVSCGQNQDSVFLLSMPAAHNFNLAGPGLLGTLLVGGCVVMCENSAPEEIVGLIQREKITETALVPSLAMECIEYAKSTEQGLASFDSLRLVQLGGAVCTEDVVDSVHQNMHCIPQQIYGMGEGIICATSYEEDMDIIRKFQGKNLSAYCDIQIMDEQGKFVADGIDGEIVAKGPGVISEYYNSAEANVSKFTADGYYRTGDRGRIQNGYIVVAGRIDDLINKGGEKISPSEIAACLKKCKGVLDAEVVSFQYQRNNTLICGFVISEADVTAEELKRQCIDMHMAAYKIPDLLIKIEQWPLTSVKKIDKKELIRIAKEKSSQSGLENRSEIQFEAGMSEIEKKIARIWSKCVGETNYGKISDFILLGGNSITVAKMLQGVEDECGVQIGIDQFYQATTIETFSKLVQQKISAEKKPVKWFSCVQEHEQAKTTLLVFPHAGGSPSNFASWRQMIPDTINLYPVLYPGREARSGEEMPASVQELAREFVTANEEILKGSYAVFAHCAGASIAYEVVIQAQKRYGTAPVVFIASGAEAPEYQLSSLAFLKNASAEQFGRYLVQEGFVEQEVLDNPFFAEYYMPIIRQDFELMYRYKATGNQKIQAPICLMIGEQDKVIEQERAKEWSRYTTVSMETVYMQGGHYYFNENSRAACAQVCSIVQKKA